MTACRGWWARLTLTHLQQFVDGPPIWTMALTRSAPSTAVTVLCSRIEPRPSGGCGSSIPTRCVPMSKRVRPCLGVGVRLTDIPGREVSPASQALEQIRGWLAVAVEPVEELLTFLG